MRFRKRKPIEVCQNCKQSNNDKGKWKRTWKRKSDYKKGEHPAKLGYWHIFCELKKRFYPWDYRKRCFKMNRGLKYD